MLLAAYIQFEAFVGLNDSWCKERFIIGFDGGILSVSPR